jgi:DNA-binding IclR family transcriptional regulator
MKTAVKALRLLREFTRQEPELGVNELARRLDADPATAYRLLKALQAEGFVEQDGKSKKYRLGLAVLELASGLLQQRGIVGVAMPALERLYADTAETVSLDAFNGGEVVCLAALNCPQEVRTTNFVGERTPLHCTSAGLIFLAYMPPAERRRHLAGELPTYTPKTATRPALLQDLLAEVSRTGMAVSDESYHPGVRGISAPVFGPEMRVAATVSITAPKQRLTLKQLAALSKSVKATAEDITAALHRLDATGSLLPAR